MPRRADSDRIFMARRVAIRNGLTNDGISLEHAEAWCDAWEVEADVRGIDRASPDYWGVGIGWITEQRKTRRLGR
jgi:hypothetical protein